MARRSAEKKPSLIRGIILTYLGFNVLISAIGHGSFLAILFGGVFMGLGVAQLVAVITGGKKRREERSKPPVKRQTRVKPESFVRSEPEEPLRPRNMSRRDKDLEQLKSLYSAGLYTKEEFEKKRREILNMR